jgi:hypothetical protein
VVSDERGQLILVGALAVAVSIVGLTVFLNTTLFTESVAPSTSNDQIDEARQFELQTRQDATELLHRVNTAERNRTATGVGSSASAAVANYSEVLAASYARSGSVTVGVAIDVARSGNGTRVVQVADANLTAPGGSGDESFESGDWEPLSESGVTSPRQTVGWFVADVNVKETRTSAATLTFENATGAELEVELRRNETGTGGDLTVRSEASFAPTRQVTCDPTFGRALVDLYRGEVTADNCADASFTGVDELSPPHSLEVEDGRNLVAEYEYVLNETAPGNGIDECVSGVDVTDPCETPALWRVNLSTTYRGTRVEYTNGLNVSIYANTDP